MTETLFFWWRGLRKYYEVSYIDGKYVINILPGEYDVVGFYTDSKGRKRPITRSRRRVRNVETKVVHPKPPREAVKIVRDVAVSRRPTKTRVVSDWWDSGLRHIYEELRRHGSSLTPIHLMALYREVKKRRPEWSSEEIYNYLDSKLDSSLTYDELKTIVVDELGATPEESIRRYDKPLSEKEIEDLYQDYLRDVEELGVDEDYEPGDISLLIKNESGPMVNNYNDYFGEVY